MDRHSAAVHSFMARVASPACAQKSTAFTASARRVKRSWSSKPQSHTVVMTGSARTRVAMEALSELRQQRERRAMAHVCPDSVTSDTSDSTIERWLKDPFFCYHMKHDWLRSG